MVRRLFVVSALLSVLFLVPGALAQQAAAPAKAKTPKAEITAEQLEAWRKQFPAADADKDGKLTLDEAGAYWLKLQRDRKAAGEQAAKPAAAKQAPPTAADVKYGPYARNVLDFYQAKSDQPTPVLINFHGGGFVAGDKAAVMTEPYLLHGISVVSANYRFVHGGADAAPYPAPMLDGARVVQFVRTKAKEWNIDPNRVALTGGSAGAVMAMWIAYRDDMRQADSDDPIARESTRVACIVPIAGPTNLDPAFIRREIGGNPIVHPSLIPFYGVASEDELRTAEKQRLIREASPMTHVTADDPPTFLLYGGELSKTPLPADTDVSISIHHPRFGVLLKEQLDKVGVPNDLAYPNDGRSKVQHTVALQAFLQKHLLQPPAP